MCGRDFRNSDQTIGNLKRKAFTVSTGTFTAPELMATVSGGTTSFLDALVCFETSSITFATIDNTKFAYYVELELQQFVQVVVAQVDY